jgi:riboflavin kinase/FMN adenylyltransferase
VSSGENQAQESADQGNKVGMSFREQLASATPNKDTVITIGVFDGVHQGHRYLMRRLCELANPNYLPVVITFVNHPQSVLRSGSKVSYITTAEEKDLLIRKEGIELVISLAFTQELSKVSARGFTSMLVNLMRMKGLVIGPDFALGNSREGGGSMLRQLGAEQGFWVATMEPLLLEGEPIRSRRIRETITNGDMIACTLLLGRKFSLSGSVIKGNGQGREFGIPTANMAVPFQLLLPGDGIYATWAIIGGVRHPSVTSIGVRPTFGLTERLIEVHVMEFNGDLYGQQLGVEFVCKLRNQETFPTAESLVGQMNIDISDSLLALANDSEAGNA